MLFCHYHAALANRPRALSLCQKLRQFSKHDLLFYFNPQHARILNYAIIDVRSPYRHLATILVRDGENTDNCVTILPTKIQYDDIWLID